MSFSFTEWYTRTPYEAPVASSPGPAPYFRDGLDQLRSGYKQVPEAQYPDGYLGTITDRRSDRLSKTVETLGRKSYQRGVHKGEKINQDDYSWPRKFNPDSGIHRQMVTAQRFAPAGTVNERLIGAGRLPLPSSDLAQMDPYLVQDLKKYAPPWT